MEALWNNADVRNFGTSWNISHSDSRNTFCSRGHGSAPLGTALAPSPTPIQLSFSLLPHHQVFQFELPMTTHRDIIQLSRACELSTVDQVVSLLDQTAHIYPTHSSYGI